MEFQGDIPICIVQVKTALDRRVGSAGSARIAEPPQRSGFRQTRSPRWYCSARRCRYFRHQLRQIAAQHTHASTPPRHAPHVIRLEAIEMGRQFDRIMHEARRAGVEERHSYRHHAGAS
jgi:hypothetical protein